MNKISIMQLYNCIFYLYFFPGITENLDGEVSVLTKRFIQKNTEVNDNLSYPEVVPSQQRGTSKTTYDTQTIGNINNFTHSCGFKIPNTKRSVGYTLRRVRRNTIVMTFTLLIILIGFRVWLGYREYESTATVVGSISFFCFLFLLWNCFRYVFCDHKVF